MSNRLSGSIIQRAHQSLKASILSESVSVSVSGSQCVGVGFKDTIHEHIRMKATSLLNGFNFPVSEGPASGSR